MRPLLRAPATHFRISLLLETFVTTQSRTMLGVASSRKSVDSKMARMSTGRNSGMRFGPAGIDRPVVGIVDDGRAMDWGHTHSVSTVGLLNHLTAQRQRRDPRFCWPKLLLGCPSLPGLVRTSLQRPGETVEPAGCAGIFRPTSS